MNNPNNIPQHVAIIMDGNGRWAKSRGLPKIAGHRAGAKTVDEITTAAREQGISVLTLYAFSTENWKRPEEERRGLFRLLEEYIDKEEAKLNKNNIRFSVIGDIAALPESTKTRIARVRESSKNNSAMVLNIALNYGSRQEITSAAREISREVKSGSLEVEAIDEKLFSRFLYTKDLPDPDLLIRTSGESRVSNFLLWQISYAEIYVTDKLWPDFKKEDFKIAILEYQKRERRFGG